MPTFKKIVLILSVVFFSRLLFSCCDCDNSSIPFDINNASIENIENSGEWPGINPTDIMQSQAAAFKITLGTDSIVFAAANCYSLNNLGFTKAFSCECSTPYHPNQKITDIRISNIYSINTSIPINTELSNDHFVYAKENWNSFSEMYLSKESFLETINPEIVSDTPEFSFMIFLKDKIENNTAQFLITIELSNGESLVLQTRILTIQ